MNKYKVGQKVIIKENINGGDVSTNMITFVKEMKEYKGKILTINKTNAFGNDYEYQILEDKGDYYWDEEWLEPVNEVESKEDLNDGDIVTLGNGERLLFAGGDFHDLGSNANNLISDLDDLNDDLTFNRDYLEEENKVVKVERPTTYYEVFKREETVKELTVEEISKLLGYEVKIVKNK